MASPAQIANDMDVRAAFWGTRDRNVAAACRDAGRVIRGYLFGPSPDGRVVHGVLTRLYRIDGEWLVKETPDLRAALARAAEAIQSLRREARDGVR
jgi:hypothetical protein